MAFTVQSDEGDVADANAYIDVDFFTSYHTDRNVTAVVDSEYDETSIKGAIVGATDYMDNRFKLKGEKLDEDQTTEFPRDEWTGIPRKWKAACAEYALNGLVNGKLAPTPEYDATGLQIASKREEVGPLKEETTYVQTSRPLLFKPYPAADMLMKEFIASSTRVIR